jgi:hypothetical protein
LQIVLVYRPPRDPFSERDANNTTKLCASLSKLSALVLVLGDFNLPAIDWERVCSANAWDKVVLDLFQSMFWSQHVDIRTHCDGNILDLVLSSDAGLVHGVSYLGILAKGDHTMMEVPVTGPTYDKSSKVGSRLAES